MNPATSLGTRSKVGMAKPSLPLRQAGNIGHLLVIRGVCRRSLPSACAHVKYRCRCRDRRCPTTCLWWFLGPLRSPGLPSAETALVQKPQYDMCPTVPWYGSGTEDMGADDLSTGVDGGTLGTIRR